MSDEGWGNVDESVIEIKSCGFMLVKAGYVDDVDISPEEFLTAECQRILYWEWRKGER